MEIKIKGELYDVCIVGSGAGGGMAAKILTEAGLKVALIEAGPDYDPANKEQQTQLKWPYESPRRGANTNRAFGDFDAAYGGWEIEGEPYTRTCLEVVQTTGEGFPYALVQMILRDMILMA